jgi:hypothetical protein
MPICKDIQYCVDEIFKKSKYQVQSKDKAKIMKALYEYIDKLIFNIVAVASLICIKLGIKEILKEHMISLREYIDKRCRLTRTKKSVLFKGGAFNTAAFYGVNEPQYSATNEGKDIMNIDWNNNLARPALNMTMTGGGKYTKKINSAFTKKMSNVFNFFNIKVSKSICNEFVSILKIYINELFDKLGKGKKELTVLKLSSVLKSSKILKKYTK